MSAAFTPNMPALRTDLVAPAAVASRLQQMGARLVAHRPGASVYLAASGHKLRVVPRSASATAIEIYPAGCAC